MRRGLRTYEAFHEGADNWPTWQRLHKWRTSQTDLSKAKMIIVTSRRKPTVLSNIKTWPDFYPPNTQLPYSQYNRYQAIKRLRLLHGSTSYKLWSDENTWSLHENDNVNKREALPTLLLWASMGAKSPNRRQKDRNPVNTSMTTGSY